MKRPQLVPQGLVNRRMQEVQAAWARKDFQAVIEILESARRLAPSNLDILITLGQVNGWGYNYEAAEQSFEKALRFASRKTEMLVPIGDQCKNFRNLKLAERYFQLALKQPDVTA